VDVRPYLPADRDACLAVLDSNTPDFFLSQERRHFEEFLEHLNCSYFVMEQESAIVGCGGYVITEDMSVARLVWGMVHRDWLRQGLGRFLLLFRLREVTKAGGVQTIRLETSQHSAPFFESQGFKVVRVTKDGRAEGLDRVELTMKLTVCP
jgi:N-acetylglutamate synthase-like GNAT family acetyltransferase